ncbi:MAG TPA: PLD nuclease N-terminal domain-containing protein, partial [Candidatus Saccharibacteria bacterium]|nr:PLD nuclease N-terminal domain-containing protein [Candidatus Saccharibacteria bacterium]
MSKYVSDYDRKTGGFNVTWILVILLFAILGIVIYFASTGKFSADKNQQSVTTDNTTTISSTGLSSASNTTNVRKGQLPQEPSLDQSKKVIMGVAQLAPSGLYKYVFETDGVNHRLVDKKLQKELINEGFFPSAEDLNKGLKSYIDEMFNKSGVTN